MRAPPRVDNGFQGGLRGPEGTNDLLLSRTGGRGGSGSGLEK